MFYYFAGDRRFGPADERAIIHLIKSGVIKENTLIQKEGWKSARRAVVVFKDAFAREVGLIVSIDREQEKRQLRREKRKERNRAIARFVGKTMKLCCKRIYKTARFVVPFIGKATVKGASAVKDAAGQGVEYVKRISREYDGVTEFRTWTTADGKHQITARLIGMNPNGKVQLQKEDQKFTEIAPQQLCDVDREYLEMAMIDM